MKKSSSKRTPKGDSDTMRTEYDFSTAVRGLTAARYAAGANVVVIDPEVLDVFPDSDSVNGALRALAPVLRKQRQSIAKKAASKKRSSSARSKPQRR